MTPWVQRILIATVLMFFVQQTVAGATSLLYFVPSQVLARPWTIVTYMFLHGGLGHIFWNMLGLYFFGPRVESRMGSQRFITLYLVAGIVGALFSLVLAPRNPILGASGAVLGVLMAFARFWPRERLLIWGIVPIEARWLVIIYAAIDILGFNGFGRLGVANVAHLGGFAGALLYLLFLERRQGARRFKQAATPKVAESALGNWRQVDRGSIHAVNREEVDRILDKISASGLASLTPQERQFLSNFVPPDDRKPA
ncbi:MAG TPA: rhomboid family intramembrane serine protease [Gemmatimonadaceae bacterium]|nr:rhomboid family intramembrane serine protease [Gemmatimonadaceae bacterium]